MDVVLSAMMFLVSLDDDSSSVRMVDVGIGVGVDIATSSEEWSFIEMFGFFRCMNDVSFV